MNNTEINFLILFLEVILINQQDSSCNDLILPINETTIQFMEFFNQHVKDNEKLTLLNNEIVGLDLSVTEYFIKKLKTTI